MQGWKTLGRRTLVRSGRFLTLERRRVQAPGGQRIDDWPWVITPAYANVVARRPDGRFICFRQTKYAVRGTTLALVGGYVEPGERPLAAARRELREEAGCRAARWIALGRYVVDSNRGAGVAHLYLALDARPARAVASDDLEPQRRVDLTRAELERALDRGAFKVLPWAAAAALALRRLDAGAAPRSGRAARKRRAARRERSRP
jgi:ADP-ribose pyrophosphatase